MVLPPPRPRDSPTELERERLGRGDGAAGEETRAGENMNRSGMRETKNTQSGKNFCAYDFHF